MRSLLAMNVVMPVIAVVVAATLNLPPEIKIALGALLISPVPPTLPKKELQSGGRASYAIGLLVTVAVLAIAFAPFAVEVFDRVFGQTAMVAPVLVSKVVLQTILIPLVAGIAARQWFPQLAARAALPITRVATVLLVLAVLLVA